MLLSSPQRLAGALNSLILLLPAVYLADSASSVGPWSYLHLPKHFYWDFPGTALGRDWTEQMLSSLCSWKWLSQWSWHTRKLTRNWHLGSEKFWLNDFAEMHLVWVEGHWGIKKCRSLLKIYFMRIRWQMWDYDTGFLPVRQGVVCSLLGYLDNHWATDPGRGCTPYKEDGERFFAAGRIKSTWAGLCSPLQPHCAPLLPLLTNSSHPVLFSFWSPFPSLSLQTCSSHNLE